MYFAQVQGLMAIGGCTWCDFVMFTINIQHIKFGHGYWTEKFHFAPELVSPVHALGHPVRDLLH